MDLSLGGLTGNTPLIKISEKIYAKLETYNPTGSVKDRVVSYIVNRAIQAGKINPGSVLCEATSGNTGIALSACAANLGLPCIIFMPSDMSEERKQMMKVYGADIVEAPPSDFAQPGTERRRLPSSRSSASLRCHSSAAKDPPSPDETVESPAQHTFSVQAWWRQCVWFLCCLPRGSLISS